MKKEIKLKERGTTAVMEWIATNNPNHLNAQIFSCNGEPFLIVSDHDEHCVPYDMPVEKWHDVNGAKRLMNNAEGAEPHWYFYINGRFYFATIY